MTPTIDLNCDLGEGFGNDALLMRLISSANIACGGHAGDEATMRETVSLAKACWVSVGAHPGYEDREAFGRKDVALEPAEVFALVARQIAALKKITDAADVALTHVKPHGALYNKAAQDAATAKAVADAVAAAGRHLVLYALAGSELVNAGVAAGLHVASEVFADRVYQVDGSLTPRNLPGALHTLEKAMIGQVLDMVERGMVKTREGFEIALHADTVCLHGDGPHAVVFAKRIRQALTDVGVRVKPCLG